MDISIYDPFKISALQAVSLTDIWRQITKESEKKYIPYEDPRSFLLNEAEKFLEKNNEVDAQKSILDFCDFFPIEKIIFHSSKKQSYPHLMTLSEYETREMERIFDGVFDKTDPSLNDMRFKKTLIAIGMNVIGNFLNSTENLIFRPVAEPTFALKKYSWEFAGRKFNSIENFEHAIDDFNSDAIDSARTKGHLIRMTSVEKEAVDTFVDDLINNVGIMFSRANVMRVLFFAGLSTVLNYYSTGEPEAKILVQK